MLELLIERSKDTRNLTPVFTFSQVAQLRKICRFLHLGMVNLLFFSPQDYQARREYLLPSIKQILESMDNPTFCGNPPCGKPLTNDSRNDYCNDVCQRRAIDARKATRKRQLQPFESLPEIPPLSSVE